jgi:hypothetical protein
MARVWADSKHAGTDLLMLLAIADFADDDGNAYPSVGTLAIKCRTTSRHVNRILASLRTSGELEIRMNEGPRGTNRYRISFMGMTPASPLTNRSPLTPASPTPDVHVPKPLTPTSDEPSLNHQRTGGTTRAARSPAADRGSRLSADWTLPDDWRAWAERERPDLEPDQVAQRFQDHWAATPGAKGRKSDWFATWRNWVRNERQQASRQQSQSASPWEHAR